jgi:hypothetical protein
MDPIDDDVPDPRGVLPRIFVRGLIQDDFRIEDHKIGSLSCGQYPAIFKAQPPGRQRGHLAYRLLKGHILPFPYITP